MRVLQSAEFDRYWRQEKPPDAETVFPQVRDIINAVRRRGDAAVREFAARFDKCSPETLEVPAELARRSYQELGEREPELLAALECAAEHGKIFALRQRAQYADFEFELAPGLFTGQRVVPVQRAAIYVPGGRFPLISSVLMGLIPAMAAGVAEIILASPPQADGFPDRRILAAAHLAARRMNEGRRPLRYFALGGAQGIAALALGTGSVPQVDLIAGPGNRYVAAAKQLLFGEVGIDFIAGPTDVLIIADGAGGGRAMDRAAADMLAQAEHDPDARSRVLLPNRDLAEELQAALERRLGLAALDPEQREGAAPGRSCAAASLERGALMVIYDQREEAVRIANAIAPEHLELQVADPDRWIPGLVNYGSLFIGSLAVEALGDYTAGINHTLPTRGSARFSGGLSVRHFLKILTSLRGAPGPGYAQALEAAKRIARAEGLFFHAESAASREAGDV
ncbi:MAG: histidinol dehydrogenase [Treponema sp.]|jgi:histidinol dehydrogenase|nr:histidinol dehydrogenase [Treponema sp.]